MADKRGVIVVHGVGEQDNEGIKLSGSRRMTANGQKRTFRNNVKGQATPTCRGRLHLLFAVGNLRFSFWWLVGVGSPGRDRHELFQGSHVFFQLREPGL